MTKGAATSQAFATQRHIARTDLKVFRPFAAVYRKNVGRGSLYFGKQTSRIVRRRPAAGQNLVLSFCVSGVRTRTQALSWRSSVTTCCSCFELDQLVVRSCSSENLVLQQGSQGGPGYVCDLAGDKQGFVAATLQHPFDHVAVSGQPDGPPTNARVSG